MTARRAAVLMACNILDFYEATCQASDFGSVRLTGAIPVGLRVEILGRDHRVRRTADPLHLQTYLVSSVLSTGQSRPSRTGLGFSGLLERPDGDRILEGMGTIAHTVRMEVREPCESFD
jgi:hypothetical protein